MMIIGESGSGKSTLLSIIKNYYQVPGHVLIGGIDRSKYDYQAYEDIGYFSQNETLFTGTLYENLVCSCRDNKQIEKISKICCVDEIVKKNTSGINLYIEENGFNLSGGEKSRIALARLLLKNPKILLLDETFSQMDVSLERKIIKNIISSFPKMTVMIVSHRIDNWDLVNHVVEISQGKIIRNIKKRR